MLFVLFLPPGAPSAYQVLQSPRFAAPKPGESVTIHCSHNVSIFERILWYKREKHGALRYLGYMNRSFPYPEGDVKDKMNFGGDGSKHATLNISTVSENDSAIYFCAASRHSTAESLSVNTKTLHKDRDLNTCSQPPCMTHIVTEHVFSI